MLYLNSKDIEAAVDRSVLIEKMETAMKLAETNKVIMPPRAYVEYKDNSLGLMPCFSDTGFSTKLVTIFPGNHGGPDPVVNGLVILNNIKNGAPQAIFNGETLTAIRTGAVGAVGVKNFASREPHALGIVGAGIQGFEQILCAATARPLTDIHVYDLDASRLEDFVSRLRQRLPGIAIHPAAGTDKLAAACRTIVMATTSTRPVLPDSRELLKGRCLIATGSFRPDMQELPRAAFECAGQMFLDTAHARHESGDVITPVTKGWIPEDAVRTMGQYLLSGEGWLQGKTTIFKSVGMAVFDLLAAEYIYESALAQGLGQNIDP